MNLNKLTIIIFCSTLAFLSGCESTKNVITGKTKTNSDEFLVKKKNPLILPPDYNELPLPKGMQNSDLKEIENDNEKIKKLLGETTEDESRNNDNTLENSILKTLKND